MKLVLFDLDGTLVSHRGSHIYEWTQDLNKWSYAIETVFHKKTAMDFASLKGRVDKQILWLCAEPLGITKEVFEQKLPALCQAMYNFFTNQTKDANLYQNIPEARKLVELLQKQKDYDIGVLTGNITLIARWKLNAGGYDDIFPFGLFGEEADDRILLAKSVFIQAKEFFHHEFLPSDITVIGDTIHDIACGKAINAATIGITNLGDEQLDELKKEGADMAVDSLMDKSVLDYFGLKTV